MTTLIQRSLSSLEHQLDQRCDSYAPRIVSDDELSLYYSDPSTKTMPEVTMMYPTTYTNIPCDTPYSKSSFPGKENLAYYNPITTVKQHKALSPLSTEVTESDAEVERVGEAVLLAPKPVDDSDLKSSSSVSNWCSQMVCYIWFGGAAVLDAGTAATTPTSSYRPASESASPVTKRHSKKLSLGSLSESVTFSVRDLHNAVEAHARSAVENNSARPSAHERSSDPRALRLYPRRRFTEFVRNMLNTTQVSKSVIILALLYIHRLKSKNPGLRGQDGSEFRLFVTALMLANKFLDDHTYTNKTWSELSGLKLKDVTKMEIEFWLGLSSNIYVSDLDFKCWIGTLESLAERRQYAISRREQDKIRQSALQQHQQSQQLFLLQQQQQQQYLPVMHEAPRCIAHNSRTSHTRSWSPDSHAYQTRSSPGFVPVHHSVSPTYAYSASSASRASNDYDVCLASFDTTAPTSAYLTTRPSSMRDFSFGIKRAYALDSPSGDPLSFDTASPERANKRRTMSRSNSRAGTPSARAYGLSPPFAQPCPRSVFEPLVSTPNTLLAPYAMQQSSLLQQQQQQQKQYPLAYWQLAAGHDRGILGVHLPAPIACHSDYFEHVSQPAHHDTGRAYQHQYERSSRRPLATTTPYPTPPMDAFPGSGAGQQLADGHLHYHYPGGFVSHAPHAPFNNAESHYIDPLSIRF